MMNAAVPTDLQVPLAAESFLHAWMAVHMDFRLADHLFQIPLAAEIPNRGLIHSWDQTQPLLPGEDQKQVSHSSEESPGP